MPVVVSGWSSIWWKTLAGIVATSQPSRAASITCLGCRIEAASTWVVTPAGRRQSTISFTTAVESMEMSSRRPMKHETYVAPASAVRSAWVAEKTRVMLTRAPSSASARVAARPSEPNGTFTTTCSCRSRRARPSRTMPAASVDTTSAETGPFTSSQIRRMLSPGSASSLARRLGFVVAPDRTPQAAISSTSATEPVSMKNRMFASWRRVGVRGRGLLILAGAPARPDYPPSRAGDRQRLMRTVRSTLVTLPALSRAVARTR
jgi:hypothetical protein